MPPMPLVASGGACVWLLPVLFDLSAVGGGSLHSWLCPEGCLFLI